ncbi:MAG: MBL fold metallo-hydrolase [Sandaracinaceae bacterium]|nr:MBL fold metallo-hydrolase [Sandaracinaceae bacterium]
MIFRQFIESETSTYTYLVASRKSGEAILIDPVKEMLESYLRILKELDLKLVYALDTHVHADHVTALGALREATGAVSVMGAETRAACVSERIKDGDILRFGGLEIKALHTPGHTDDSYSYLMNDRVFTGDTLLIRGTGRTDFQNGDPSAQYDSIFGKLLTLPDETLVYPGHDYRGWTVSTIGEERRFNPRLQVKSREEYIELMNNLRLDHPKYMDVAVPANLECGLN